MNPTALIVLLLTAFALAHRSLPDDGKGSSIKNGDMSGEAKVDVGKQKDLDSKVFPKKETVSEQKPTEMPFSHFTHNQKPNPTTKHFDSGESFEQMHDQKKDYSKKKVTEWSHSGSHETSSSRRPSHPRDSSGHTSSFAPKPSSTPRAMDLPSSFVVMRSSPLTPVTLPVASTEPRPHHSEMRSHTAGGVTHHPHSASAHPEHHSSMQPKSENATMDDGDEIQKEEIAVEKEVVKEEIAVEKEVVKEEIATEKKVVKEESGSENKTEQAQAAPLPCTTGSVCFGDNECPDGRCLGLAVGKCNCGACVTFKPCSKDFDCGGLIGACDHAVKYCNCEKGFAFNGYNLLDSWMKLCNIKDCTPSSRSCFGLPCNAGLCAC